jgi:hypothetical protein
MTTYVSWRALEILQAGNLYSDVFALTAIVQLAALFRWLEERAMTSGINRRDAIMVSLGLADRVAMEREQQSAIDAVRGYADDWDMPAEPEDSVPSAPGGSRLACVRARLRRIRLPAFLSRRL